VDITSVQSLQCGEQRRVEEEERRWPVALEWGEAKGGRETVRARSYIRAAPSVWLVPRRLANGKRAVGEEEEEEDG
jgi:hypothetical protein